MTSRSGLASVPLPDPAPAASRRAVCAAHAIALLTLPTGLWRLLLAAGFTAGYTEAGYAAAGLPGWGRAYALGVTLGSELLALLALGLVRPWGVVLPARIPRLGGRRLPVRAVAAAAGATAVLLTCAWTPFLLWWTLPHPDMTPRGALVVGLLYLPLVAWGPLLGALTLSYRRRTAAGGRPAGLSGGAGAPRCG
ncbi:hypothetical protein SUDANB120_02857 [Streptomyces sp. enrichment culture]|uniref:hypothetical protein n=1 Tax=Streptomyces sp. enrichment culture TaxID=1795815 RepID=UPI003F549F46